MIRGIYDSLAGMLTSIHRQDATAQNIANLDTAGYRRERIVRRDFGMLLGRGDGAVIGEFSSGVLTDGRTFVPSAGPIEDTGVETDLAINGDALFTVRLADGSVGYTRNGHFGRDVEGNLVNDTGARLLDTDGRPVAAPEGFGVALDGTVTPGGARIALAAFPSQGLIPAGGGIFRTERPLAPAADATISQSVLEGSNVDLVDEMADLLMSQRAFQLNARALSIESDSLEQAATLGRVK